METISTQTELSSATDGMRQRARELTGALLRAALRAVDPEAAVRRVLRFDGSTLQVGEERIPLAPGARVVVLGGGKAAAAMAAGVEAVLGDRVSGLVNVKDAHLAPTRRVALHEASHPVPDARGAAGVERMEALLRGLGPDDLVLALISGGGSALLAAPAEGISLADKQAVTHLLLRAGATIGEINTVRRHLSRLKGGQLARLAQPARLVTLILSDVVGSPLDVIASGPTVPDPSTYADALRILDHYHLTEAVPEAVLRRLRAGSAGELPETPKPGDPVFAQTVTLVLADVAMAAQAALDAATGLGLNAAILTTWLEGEAREVGRVCAAIARELAQRQRPLTPPACLILGGETTVTVRGHGRGGRCQELALAAGLALAGVDGAAVAAVGTDGTDGPTDAAGAIADGSTVARARAVGLDPVAALRANDSHPFFARLGDLVVTGPTNTNVNDLVFIFAFAGPPVPRARGRATDDRRGPMTGRAGTPGDRGRLAAGGS